MFGHAWFRRRDESMHLSALVKRRFDCAYQRGQAWKTIGLASWRMTCLARAHAHSKPRTHGFTTYSLQHRGHWHQAVELCRTFSFSNRFIYRIVPFICYGILCVLERDGNFDIIELKKKDGMCIDFITSRYGNLWMIFLIFGEYWIIFTREEKKEGRDMLYRIKARQWNKTVSRPTRPVSFFFWGRLPRRRFFLPKQDGRIVLGSIFHGVIGHRIVNSTIFLFLNLNY